MHSEQKRRNKKSSITTPFLFEVLELILIWIVFGIFEGTLNVFAWGLISYGFSAVWVIYTIMKLKRVIKRQSKDKF